MMKKKSIIFDVDGVLVDSEKLSCKALNLAIKRLWDIDIGNDYTSVIGKSNEDAIRYYLNEFGKQISENDIKYTSNIKTQIYFELAQSDLHTFPGIHDALNELKSEYILGVASSGSLKKIKFSLSKVNLLHFFSYISTVDEVKRGKPYPDIFVHTMKKMQILPKNTIVIEDSIPGIKAAKNSGAYTIGFSSTYNADKLIDNGADVVIDTYFELPKILDNLNII